MLKIDGNDIYREGAEVGYLSGSTVYANNGSKLGWYEDGRIYNEDADRVGYLEGGYLWAGDRKISLDYVNQTVEGGALSELAKCALYLLIGV